MWAAERAGSSYALLRVALDTFTDGHDAVPKTAYRSLPGTLGYAIQHRYVGQ